MPTLICVSLSKEELQAINTKSRFLQANCAPNDDEDNASSSSSSDDSCWPD